MCLECGIKKPAPVLRLALRGWIGFVEAASLDWLDHRDVARDELRALLGSALEGSLRAAGALPNTE